MRYIVFLKVDGMAMPEQGRAWTVQAYDRKYKVLKKDFWIIG